VQWITWNIRLWSMWHHIWGLQVCVNKTKFGTLRHLASMSVRQTDRKTTTRSISHGPLNLPDDKHWQVAITFSTPCSSKLLHALHIHAIWYQIITTWAWQAESWKLLKTNTLHIQKSCSVQCTHNLTAISERVSSCLKFQILRYATAGALEDSASHDDDTKMADDKVMKRRDDCIITI